jgi:putative FmdB family regulatory protein
MPMYDYDCDRCGPFTALRPMAEFEAPCACPHCEAMAPRVMLTAPAIATMPGARRHAAATNERSADTPGRSHAHGAGCGCGAGSRRGRGVGEPQAAKGFPSRRPWMISH